MWRSLILLLLAWGAPALAQFPPLPPGPPPTEANIAYAPADPATNKGHLLDLYLPPRHDKPVPVLIYTGGSAWFFDNGKDSAGWVAAKLLPEGYAVAGVSVRSSSQTHFPGQLHDIKAAIRWLRANAARYHLDANHIGIMGDSSGGWASAIAATTGDVSALEGNLGTTGVSSAVQAAVAFYPPTTLIEMDRWALHNCKPGLGMRGIATGEFCHDDADSPESNMIGCAIQGCTDKALAADPARYISAADPPILILHGESDPLVPHNQGERLYMALQKACHDAIFVSLPLAGHGPPWGFLEDEKVHAGASVRSTRGAGCQIATPQLATPDWKMLIDFLNAHLK
jgi:acetyl esterase/lipase